MAARSAAAGFLAMTVLVVCVSQVQADLRCEIDHAVIDGTKIDYGVTVEVVGRCEENDFFDLSGIAILEMARLNARANQDRILLHLRLSPSTPGGDEALRRAADALRAMRPDQWYRLRGYLADGNASAKQPSLCFVVERFEPVPASPLGLPDFVDRQACIEGRAEQGAILNASGIPATVAPLAQWPSGIPGKTVAVRGLVRHDAAGWRIEDAAWKLVDLADQVGQDVSLEGRFWSMNGQWWFDYRDEKLYVVDDQNRLVQSSFEIPTAEGGNVTPDFLARPVRDRPFALRSNDHGRRARVCGQLVRQLRPSLEQISLKTDRDLVPCYVVRRATLAFLEENPRHWRFRTLYSPPYPMVEGIPELLAECSIRRNIMGNETKAGLYHERNGTAVDWILEQASNKTMDVLARRMTDAKQAHPLRLLYAAMLAAKNDPRGRAFLLEALRTQDEESLADAFYCIGSVAWLTSRDSNVKPELAWAEPALVDLMAKRDARGEFRAARIAAQYSKVPEILVSLNTPASRAALIDFALSEGGEKWQFRQRICKAGVLFPMEDLLRLEAAAKGRYDRWAILSQFLGHKSPDAVRRFLEDLGDGFVYMDFRDHLSPEIIEALKSNLERMSPQARIHAQMLIILGQKDAVPAILALLDDPSWRDKNLAMFELARLKDARAVIPVARKLRDADQEYFNFDPEAEPPPEQGQGAQPSPPSELRAGMAVQHALEAIANTRSKEAVAELIELLPADLSRFGTYIDREGFRRIIAAHLIEMTGESFGVDAEAWRKWSEGDH